METMSKISVCTAAKTCQYLQFKLRTIFNDISTFCRDFGCLPVYFSSFVLFDDFCITPYRACFLPNPTLRLILEHLLQLKMYLS